MASPKISEYVTHAARKLSVAGIGTARLDVLVLLEDLIGKNRAWLLAHPEYELSAAQSQELEKLLNRRARHEPLAYIRGRTDFYGREFVLTPAVLQPRPESETMIELLKTLPLFRKPTSRLSSPSAKNPPSVRIADVGAGSGALGITAQLELPHTVVELLEIDPKALAVAKINVDKLTLSISVILSDLLAQSGRDYDVLLCNLPYVPDDFTINRAALQEPKIAIFGGPDGLELYRRLFGQIQELTKQPLYILTEALPPQHHDLAVIAQGAGYKLEQTNDFIQQFALAAKSGAQG